MWKSRERRNFVENLGDKAILKFKAKGMILNLWFNLTLMISTTILSIGL